jgi:hypothetical protein
MTRAGRAAALAAAGVALGAGAADAKAPTLLQRDVNPYWSGYVVTSATLKPVSYTSVTGTWTQPTATCAPGDAGASSAVWVGLGGYHSRVLEQVGVNANCDAKGRPAYFAWYELVPDIARNIHAKVFPGDTIVSSVRIVGLALVALRVEDRTRHWTFTRKINWGMSDVSSAEWITEAPNNCLRNSCQVASLANFGKVRFREIGATGNGLRGALSNPAWTTIAIRLVPGVQSSLGGPPSFAAPVSPSSHAGATPGPASSDGRAFGISWVAHARS